MAKLIETLHLSQIFWAREHNYARSNDYLADSKSLAEMAVLLHTGWNKDITPNPVVRLATTEERAQAVKRLENQWVDLKCQTADPVSLRIGDSTVFISTADQCRVFERIYTKGGKVIEPEYTGVTCFRRGASMLLAQTIRAKKGLENVEDLPVNVKVFALTDGKMDILSQIRANVEENRLKTAGATNMTNADLVGAARSMFQLNATEADLIRSLCNPNQRGLGQKLFAIVKLDSTHPSLGIVDQILSKELDFGPLSKETARKLVTENASEDKVVEFLVNPKAKNEKKIMGKPEIVRMHEQNPCVVVKLVAQAILKDDVTILSGIILHAVAINAFVKGLLDPTAPKEQPVEAPKTGAVVS